MRTVVTTLLVVAFGLAIVVVVGEPGAVLRTANLVGLGAFVEPNPYNTTAQQLAQREGELDEWERSLAEREARQREASRKLYDILAVAVGAIGALLALNYYMDWKHRRRSDT